MRFLQTVWILHRREEAGKLLKMMYERSIKENGYRYMGYDHNNSVTASLFCGSSGTGCEMLRYACPEKILPELSGLCFPQSEAATFGVYSCISISRAEYSASLSIGFVRCAFIPACRLL